MTERSLLIECIRGEIVGPSRSVTDATLVEFNGREFFDSTALRKGPLVWRPNPEGITEEVLYFERETPHRKYGAGALHPSTPAASPAPDQQAANASDTLEVEPEADEIEDASGGEIC